MPTKKVEEVVEPTEQETPIIHKNMRFYKEFQNTPAQACKDFNNGRFSGTDINPMWRIKMLTQVFGPAGQGWWTDNVHYNFVSSPDTKEIAVFCELALYFRDPETGETSKPIYGVGGNTFVAARRSGLQASDEAQKMAYTDALSIACKALGFSHDIYYSKDPTKYTNPDFPDGDGPEDEALKGVKDRIRNGVALVTKAMSKEEKEQFCTNVIAKHIGSADYVSCKDKTKLDALLKELLEIASKPQK